MSLGEENEQLCQLVGQSSFLCWLIFHIHVSTVKLLAMSLSVERVVIIPLCHLFSFQLFALQTESRDPKDGDEVVHHKLPLYIQNMDRLGDTELWDPNINVYLTATKIAVIF